MNTTLDVRNFMVACGQEVANSIWEDNRPTNTRLYLRLILEEVFELLRSISPEHEHYFINSTLENLYPLCNYGNQILPVEMKLSVADDLADINYVVHGLANALGINLEVVKDEVQSSNMSKLNPDTDKADRDVNNKVIKGPNYFKPNILARLSNESIT